MKKYKIRELLVNTEMSDRKEKKANRGERKEKRKEAMTQTCGNHKRNAGNRRRRRRHV